MSKIQITIITLVALVSSIANAERVSLAFHAPQVSNSVEAGNKPVFAQITPAHEAPKVDVLIPVATREITSEQKLQLDSSHLSSSADLLDLFSTSETTNPSIDFLSIHLAINR